MRTLPAANSSFALEIVTGINKRKELRKGHKVLRNCLFFLPTNERSRTSSTATYRRPKFPSATKRERSEKNASTLTCNRHF